MGVKEEKKFLTLKTDHLNQGDHIRWSHFTQVQLYLVAFPLNNWMKTEKRYDPSMKRQNFQVVQDGKKNEKLVSHSIQSQQ